MRTVKPLYIQAMFLSIRQKQINYLTTAGHPMTTILFDNWVFNNFVAEYYTQTLPFTNHKVCKLHGRNVRWWWRYVPPITLGKRSWWRRRRYPANNQWCWSIPLKLQQTIQECKTKYVRISTQTDAAAGTKLRHTANCTELWRNLIEIVPVD